ncbi:flagellar assembly peptidoglycan hydrolase FlgJ [Luteimonas sp. RD2P54]|uniref:Peptidoglycan hydrolase FlgJ n=1 Tax=Luteimonas endophytica TaxID=3042023 RepID=A0ABT6J7E8_9GAMM|nr:flagellar assembly peptidoglycan hydrolase FlgJ [Luteimonas endophytica]MDH5822751.1 flagellar assembly peptidoglycan hydrolase FlgJ [Luteimonas endophytica]
MRINAPIELQQATRPDAARIDEVARQFEGVFAQMLIKSMRDASFGDSLFPGENQLFRDMYDQQLAKAMTQGQGRGLGLAEVIARQLGGGAQPAADPASAVRAYALTDADRDRRPAPAALPGLREPAANQSLDLPASPVEQVLDLIAGRSGDRARESSEPSTAREWILAASAARAQASAPAAAAGAPVPAAEAAAASQAAASFPPRSPEQFVARIWSHAQQAARELGVDARALVAQAALETGWGKRMITRGDGATANNLFGIKATGWKGDRATVNTHEYTNGVRHSERADFRAYDSPAESFADYVRMIKNNPRYRQALESGGDVRRFASALQQAGYATDPAYADKISSIANGPTLGRALSAISSFATRSGDAVQGAGRVLAGAAETIGDAVRR